MPLYAVLLSFDMRLLASFLACVIAIASASVVPTPAPIYSLPLGDANSSTAYLPVLTVPNGIVLMYAHHDPSSQWGLLNPTIAFVDTTTGALTWEWLLPAESGPWFYWSCEFVPSSDGAAVFVVSQNGVWRISLTSGSIAWSRTDVKVWMGIKGKAFTLPSLLAGLLVTWAAETPDPDADSIEGQLSLLSEDTGASHWTRDLGTTSGTVTDSSKMRIIAFTVGFNSTVSTFDTATGSPLWSVFLNALEAGPYSVSVSSMRFSLLYNDVTLTSATLIAFDVASGTLLYNISIAPGELLDISETDIAVNSASFAGGAVALLSAATGVARWEFPSHAWGGSFANDSLVAVATECPCSSTGGCNSTNCPSAGGVIYGLSRDTGAVNWTSQVPAPGLPNLIPFVVPGSFYPSPFVAPAVLRGPKA